MKKYELKEVNPTCLECGDGFAYGRTDKKFCCEMCKNRYHNRKSRSTKNYMAKVTNSLDKNYRILSKLIKLNILTIDLSDLLQLGYNIDYVTSYHKIRQRKEFCCYDIKYIQTESRIYNIRKISIIK